MNDKIPVRNTNLNGGTILSHACNLDDTILMEPITLIKTSEKIEAYVQEIELHLLKLSELADRFRALEDELQVRVDQLNEEQV